VPGSGKPVGDGARYLGYGVMEAYGSVKRGTKAGQLTRACLSTPFRFTVRLRCHGLREDSIDRLRKALVALGTLGGMGARNRKGYGSLDITSLAIDGQECWKKPESMRESRDTISSLIPWYNTRTPSGYPEYTAFSGEARHVLLSSGKTEPLEVLDLIGREMVRYRSWGQGGTILGDVEFGAQLRR